MVREALGFLRAQCPSVGECQYREAGVGGLVNRGRRNEIEVFGEQTRKGDIEM